MNNNIQTPFFSIIVTAFNLENYINRSINSILDQSFQDFEIIVVNDGSTDNTAAIIVEYAKQNNKISIINHQTNESQHNARIDGVAAANGRYILFLDGDDYYLDNVFKILIENIHMHPDYDFYEFGYCEYPSGRIVFPFYTGNNRFLSFFDNVSYPSHTVWNKVYDSAILKKAFSSMDKIFINNAQDLYESIVISFYAKKTTQIKKIIYTYQIGRGVSTTYKNYDQTIEYLQSLKKVFTLTEIFLKKNNQNVKLDNLYNRFLDLTINAYILKQEDLNDKNNLFLQLENYFSTTIILGYLNRTVEILNNNKLAIINSLDYRIGHKILQPIRRLKKIIAKFYYILFR